jgi:hypothetical protein
MSETEVKEIRLKKVTAPEILGHNRNEPPPPMSYLVARMTEDFLRITNEINARYAQGEKDGKTRQEIWDELDAEFSRRCRE